MLILSRKAGEKLQIGRDITVTVLNSNGHRIRIGIDAPREIPIARMEMLHPKAEKLHRKEDKTETTNQVSEAKTSSTPYSEIPSSIGVGLSARV
jgi:carbon storage regulator